MPTTTITLNRRSMTKPNQHNRGERRSHQKYCWWCLYSNGFLLCSFFWLTLSESYVIRPATWHFRGQHPIAWERAEVQKQQDELQVADSVEKSTSLKYYAAVEAETTSSPTTTATLTKAPPRAQLDGNDQDDPTPILLLNGFGVGSFHQHRLIHEIFQPTSINGNDNKNGVAFSRNQRIYCLDYLGQGKSWPEDCQDGQGPNELDLRYCGQTWMDQIIDFIEQVILPQEEERAQGSSKAKQNIHVVGNSVGGHLAVFLAAKRPDLVESIVLLNATPVWGLNLPGWDGRLPAPWLPKRIGRYFFDQIRDLGTIEKYLQAAYHNEQAFDPTLMQQIRDCTTGNGGHAAFASIMWSPPLTVSEECGRKFYDALTELKCDVLLLFGREDPWCTVAFAKRMLEQLELRRPPTIQNSDNNTDRLIHRFVQCSNVGHCPNHEAPMATAHVLKHWLQSERRGQAPLFTEDRVPERWGTTHLEELKSQDISLSWVDRLAVTFV